MTEVVFSILDTGLKLWNTKESRKYIDQLIKLKRDWHEEYNKPPESRSDAVLDRIELELRLISLAFTAGAGKQNTPTQPG